MYRTFSAGFLLFLFATSKAPAADEVPTILSSSARLVLTDPEPSPSALLGISIGANNDRIAVGMPGVNTSTGDVLVFNRHSGELLHRLLPADAPTDNFWFGRSLDIDGDTLIVGTGGYYGEAAYVFDVNSGEQLQKLTRPARATASFGDEVAIEGNLALVSDRNFAYLFDIQTADFLGGFWANGSAYYGSRVALDQDYAYIGLPDDNAVYQFDLDTGSQVRKLRGNDTRSGDLFGEHLALDQGRLLVGAFNAPAAYLFDAATGAQLQKYQVPGAMRFDGFGSVDLSGDLVLIGASGTAIDGVGSVGAAYLFDVSSGNLLAKLRLDQFEFNNGFGRSVQLEGNSLIISAPGLYEYAGAVFVFEVPEQSAALLCCVGIALVVFAVPRRRLAASEPLAPVQHGGSERKLPWKSKRAHCDSDVLLRHSPRRVAPVHPYREAVQHRSPGSAAQPRHPG